ncbi:TRAP transporter substrate-binding protein [Polynucleobacter sp. 31A-FELB]|uniref:TRAP transporter substrate-binding protein n=1 Tax=Polynucleobacter sp. 31A-FELB TaxID=2689096 RepID=UPI001C0B0050|nr:TRAP transporter substrate-binding protein [Polynucleobacter sp. 31A-FELB]MBU3588303.1 TRAP transporter substrate-binding protein [Polynucleobacter sp. 31A-FELB]
MKISRRQLLKTAAAGSVGSILGFPAITGYAQSTYNYKVATNVQVGHSIYNRLAEAAELIKKDTDGRVNIRVFPNGQLGSDVDMLGQVRSGGIEMFSVPGVVLANLTPIASLNSVGFAFSDYPSVWKAMDGQMGLYMREQISAKSGLLVADKIWDNGFRQITSMKEISNPGDLANMKIRVPVSPMLLSIFKSLGAAPTPINFNELYSALQTKVVEGQENPLTLINNSKLYEVQKYCAMTQHVWDGYWLVSNRRSMDNLPANLREITMKHMNAAAMLQRSDSEKLAVSLQGDLAAKGMQFNKPHAAPFREALRQAKFYQEWKGKFGDEAWSKLESAVGKLA